MDKEYWWFKAKRDLLYLFLKRYKINGNILVVGFGTGEDLKLINKFGKVSGIDINKDTLKFIDKKIRKNLVIGDFAIHTYKKGSFDCIIMLDVLEHIKNDKEALKKIHRILKKNGKLILSVPAFQFLYSPSNTYLNHYRRYNKSRLIKITSKYFNIKLIIYWNFFLFIPVSIIRLIKKAIKTKSKSDLIIVSKFVNKILYSVLSLENYLISKFINLPLGISFFMVCIRKGDIKKYSY
tara:strand:+ start:4303 stop:5013 length:711 start_codon:yes stop_codon:yes gene_type:complete